ncbi:MAG: ribbon-helix-helix domain-containing protein [Pseudolabrys sp.]|nr:ribbon-helix-helix domain-containing protein [Pseudolabrys sp.]
MISSMMKRSIVLDGHKTSVSLEEPFWIALKNIARIEKSLVSKVVEDIDSERKNGNLSSAIRLYVLDYMIHASNEHIEGFVTAVVPKQLDIVAA